MAPTFDHASSLGRELNDQKRQLKMTTTDMRGNLDAYAAKARSALYRVSSDAQSLSPIDAMFEAAKIRPTALGYWLEKIDAINFDKVHAFIKQIPDIVMSDAEREFSMALMQRNVAEIKSIGMQL